MTVLLLIYAHPCLSTKVADGTADLVHLQCGTVLMYPRMSEHFPIVSCVAMRSEISPMKSASTESVSGFLTFHCDVNMFGLSASNWLRRWAVFDGQAVRIWAFPEHVGKSPAEVGNSASARPLPIRSHHLGRVLPRCHHKRNDREGMYVSLYAMYQGLKSTLFQASRFECLRPDAFVLQLAVGGAHATVKIAGESKVRQHVITRYDRKALTVRPHCRRASHSGSAA